MQLCRIVALLDRRLRRRGWRHLDRHDAQGRGPLRQAMPDRQITITYTDLPHNDFSVLFKLLHGLLPGHTENPLGKQPNVFTFASGTTFYRQIFPDFDDITRLLGDRDALAQQAADRRSPIIRMRSAQTRRRRRLLRGSALADWETILLHRARELEPGGKFVFANFCEDETGTLSRSHRRREHARHVRQALAQSAARRHDQRSRIPARQFRAILQDQGGFHGALRQSRIPPCARPASCSRKPSRARPDVPTPPTSGEGRSQSRSPRAISRRCAPGARARSWAVSIRAVRPHERMSIVNRFYGAYEAEVAASPAGHAMDYVHCFMVVGKRG